jgi:hypothetical protein
VTAASGNYVTVDTELARRIDYARLPPAGEALDQPLPTTTEEMR